MKFVFVKSEENNFGIVLTLSMGVDGKECTSHCVTITQNRKSGELIKFIEKCNAFSLHSTQFNINSVQFVQRERQ